jgi:type IV secretion system protein VirB6
MNWQSHVTWLICAFAFMLATLMLPARAWANSTCAPQMKYTLNGNCVEPAPNILTNSCVTHFVSYDKMLASPLSVSSTGVTSGLDITNTTAYNLWKSVSDQFKMQNASASSDALKAEARLVYTSEEDARLCTASPDGCTAVTKVKACTVPVYDSSGAEVVWFTYGGTAYAWTVGTVQTIGAGTTAVPNMVMGVAHIGSFNCVRALFDTGWVTLGCKISAMDSSSNTYIPKCFVSSSCSASGQSHSMGFLPITGVLVQCVKETLGTLFQSGPSACAANVSTPNLLPNFQSGLRGMVTGMLYIYVIFFGMKVALGEEVPKKGEIVLFALKMILVIFFSVGFPSNGTTPAGDALYGLGNTYTDTISVTPKTYIHGVAWIHRSLTGAMDSLMLMVMSGGSGNGLCTYEGLSYDPGYEYLKLWDAIDCRFAYYMGIDPASLVDALLPALFMIIMPTFFAFQIIVLLCLILFALLFMAVVIYVVHVYVVSMVLLTIVIYMAPLFVPMSLFTATKPYFDKWLSTALGYTLMPMVVTAFLVLMMVINDDLIYGGCSFGRSPYSLPPLIGVGGNNGSTTVRTSYKFLINNAEVESCSRTIGKHMKALKENTGGNMYVDVDALFFTITMIAIPPDYFIPALLKLLIFILLFYKFLETLDAFAGELTGVGSLGSLVASPQEIFAKSAEKAIKLAAGLIASGGVLGAAGITPKSLVDRMKRGMPEMKKAPPGGGGDDKGDGGSEEGKGAPGADGGGGKGSYPAPDAGADKAASGKDDAASKDNAPGKEGAAADKGAADKGAGAAADGGGSSKGADGSYPSPKGDGGATGEVKGAAASGADAKGASAATSRLGKAASAMRSAGSAVKGAATKAADAVKSATGEGSIAREVMNLMAPRPPAGSPPGSGGESGKGGGSAKGGEGAGGSGSKAGAIPAKGGESAGGSGNKAAGSYPSPDAASKGSSSGDTGSKPSVGATDTKSDGVAGAAKPPSDAAGSSGGGASRSTDAGAGVKNMLGGEGYKVISAMPQGSGPSGGGGEAQGIVGKIMQALGLGGKSDGGGGGGAPVKKDDQDKDKKGSEGTAKGAEPAKAEPSPLSKAPEQGPVSPPSRSDNKRAGGVETLKAAFTPPPKNGDGK